MAAIPTAVTVPLGPAVVNLTGVRAGDLNSFTVTLVLGSTPVDLTGAVVSAQARNLATDPTAAMTAVVEVTDAAAGTVSVRWPGEQVTAVLGGLAEWMGVWDLQVQSGTTDPETVCAGSLQAVMDVTRP